MPCFRMAVSRALATTVRSAVECARIDPSEHEFVFDVDRKMLENAPGFDKTTGRHGGSDFRSGDSRILQQAGVVETRVTMRATSPAWNILPIAVNHRAGLTTIDGEVERTDACPGNGSEPSMKPQVVAHELGKRLPNNAIVTGDSGSNTTWWRGTSRPKTGRCIRLRQSGFDGLWSSICDCGATGAPGASVFAFVGDGGFTMLMGSWQRV